MRAFQAAILSGLLIPAAAQAAHLQYLSGAGDKATPVVWLTWGVLAISVIVMVVIAGLLAGAIWHRPGQGWTVGDKAPILADEGGLNWLWIGVGVSTLVLLFSIVWTVKVLAQIQAPSTRPPSPSRLPASNGGGRRVICRTMSPGSSPPPMKFTFLPGCPYA